MVKMNEVEEEFWRLVNDPDCQVSVEYGADLSATDVSSGFPTGTLTKPSQKPYVTSPWNLNNMSENYLSALRFLPTNISGMKVSYRGEMQRRYSFFIIRNYLELHSMR